MSMYQGSKPGSYRAGLVAALAACDRQTALASLVAGRPSDFEKGIMSCMVAIQAEIAAADAQPSDPS